VDVLIYNLTDGFQVLPSRIYNTASILYSTVSVRPGTCGAVTVNRRCFA
jgi:hypothetical protein